MIPKKEHKTKSHHRFKVINQEEVRSFAIPSELSGRRLDYAVGLFFNTSRRNAREIVENEIVLVNDRRVTFPSKKVQGGDRVVIIKFKKTEPMLKILYEDDSLIIVDKPPGMLTQKIGSEEGMAVEEELKKMDKCVYPVHRLDRETSGVLVFARTNHARDFLVNEFKQHRVKKTYIGIVEGRLNKCQGVLKGKIKRTGEYAETFVEVMKELKGATLLKLFPRTGRTHQLRLQLAQLGNPVIGDKKYYRLKKEVIPFNRQALHAYIIEFMHPEKEEWVKFTAPIPDDMKMLIKRLEP